MAARARASGVIATSQNHIAHALDWIMGIPIRLPLLKIRLYGDTVSLIRVKRKATLTVSEGSTILRGLTELPLIDQRRQIGLKSTFCGKASATPFCQHLSRDFRSRALSRFFPCK